MFVELLVPVGLIQIQPTNPGKLVWEDYIETWRMVDEDPDVDPDTTPLYQMYWRYKKAHGLIDRLDPHWHTIAHIKLYKQIKEEGFDPKREVRMTVTFYNGTFYISNGHHRMSMLKHWGVAEILILVRLPQEKITIVPTNRELDIPVHIADMIDADAYSHYQPVIGYPEKTTEFRRSTYAGVLESLATVDWKGKKVLEVGPCFGYYSFWMDAQGADVIAVEESANRVKICKALNDHYGRNVEFIHSDIMLYDMYQDLGDIDVIFLVNVFHHMLRSYREGAFKLLREWDAPELILTVGVTLGPWALNLPTPRIPFMMLENTEYNFVKKIGAWMDRELFYFSKSKSSC